MKFAVVLLAIVGLAVAAPDVQPRDLHDDLVEIASLIPVDQIREIAQRYITSDPEVQEIIRYLKSEEWANLVALVANHPTWIRFKEYMLENGLDVDSWVDHLHDIIASLPGRRSGQTRSVQDFVNEVISVIPLDSLLLLLDDKIQNSPEFREFWDVISGPEAYALAQELRFLPEVERLAEELRQRGLEIDRIAQLAYALLGWEF